MRTFRSRKFSLPLLFVCCLLTVVNLNLINISAHDDDDEEKPDQCLAGFIAIVGGIALAIDGAGDLNAVNVFVGTATFAGGVYAVVTCNPGSSGSNDPTGGTSTMQPAPPETDGLTTVYH